MPTTLNLFAGNNSKGEEVIEEVLVEALGGDRFRFLRSPGLVLGVAADDVFELRPRGRLKIIERGSNICVQIYAPSPLQDEVEARSLELTRDFAARLDGKVPGLLVLTIPWRNNFVEIEAQLDRLAKELTGVEWFFGNVYDPEDGTTPLGWWNNLSAC